MLKIDHTNYFSFESIGEFSSDSEWIHPDRVLDSYELIFITKGEVFIREEDENYELYKNECILLESGKRHFGYKVSKNPTSFYWFHFKTDFKMPFKVYKDDEYYDVKYLLKKLLHMSKTPGYSSSAKDSAALLLFYELSQIAAATKASALANKIGEYIRIHADKGITVETAAKHFGYNADYISKLFKMNFGMGIKKYILSERIKKARDLLLNTELSIKEISAQMGFSDANHFIKFFMYHEEISPMKFRNRYFNTHMNNQ